MTRCTAKRSRGSRPPTQSFVGSRRRRRRSLRHVDEVVKQLRDIGLRGACPFEENQIDEPGALATKLGLPDELCETVPGEAQ